MGWVGLGKAGLGRDLDLDKDRDQVLVLHSDPHSDLEFGAEAGARGQMTRDSTSSSSLIGVSTERKPIDPPPIVQLRVRPEDSYLAQ